MLELESNSASVIMDACMKKEDYRHQKLKCNRSSYSLSSVRTFWPLLCPVIYGYHYVWKMKNVSLEFSNYAHNLRNSAWLILHFESTKVNWKCRKVVNLASFRTPEVFGQTVLPDRSFLIWQNLVENSKIDKLKWAILGDFLPFKCQFLWFSNYCCSTLWNIRVDPEGTLCQNLVIAKFVE